VSKRRVVPGVFPIERRGLDDSVLARLAKDAYHFLRGTTWTRLLAVFFAAFVLLNLLFASILWLGDARIINAGPSFWDRFFFSVQTMATIGYGYMAPDDWLSECVVLAESFIGVVYTAVVTGVFFGKFSTPSAKVMFSEVAVINDDEGAPTFQFRCANARATAIVEATIKVALTRDEQLPHGESVRRIYDLALRRSTSPMFALSWTVFHKIEPGSPLYGRTAQQIRDETTTIIVTLTGIDDSLASTVHTRHVYSAEQLRWGERFVDILGRDDDGTRWIDYTCFDKTVQAPVTAPE